MGRPAGSFTRPCGTLAAYRRHVRYGEQPCEACRQAMRTKTNEYNRCVVCGYRKGALGHKIACGGAS